MKQKKGKDLSRYTTLKKWRINPLKICNRDMLGEKKINEIKSSLSEEVIKSTNFYQN